MGLSPADVSSEYAVSGEVGNFMNGSELDTLVPEDELQAALAEIEKMSAEQADAIASRDDGHNAADTAPAEIPAPEPESQSPDAANGPAPEAAAAPPPAAQPDPAADDTEGAPVDGEAGGAPAAASAPPESAPEPLPQPTAEQAPADSKPERGPSTADPPSTEKTLRFKIGQTSAERAAAEVAEYQPPDKRDGVALPIGSSPPVAPLAKRVFRVLDRGLDAINRPFAWLGNTGRTTLGWVALTTLIVSILAIVLAPMSLPHRNAVTILQEKRARLAPPSSSDTTGSQASSAEKQDR